MKKTSGIYSIKNMVNGKVYLGSSCDIARRWSVHISQLRNNKHGNKELQEDFNKYGIDRFSFRIKEVCLQRDLFEREAYYLARYTQETLYNKNKIRNTKKKIRRGKEAANFKALRSEITSGENNSNCKISEITARQVIWLKLQGLKHKVIKEMLHTHGIEISVVDISRIGNSRWSYLSENDALKPEWYLSDM